MIICCMHLPPPWYVLPLNPLPLQKLLQRTANSVIVSLVNHLGNHFNSVPKIIVIISVVPE